MAYKPSVLIENSDEHLIAVVEARSIRDLSEESAIRSRNGMLEHGISAHTPYLMVLSQDVGFLWKDNPSTDENRPPDYQFPMDSIVERFLPNEPGKRLIKWGLEDLVVHWLTKLSFKPQEMGQEEPEKTLARAGFTDAIYDGMVFLGDTL